MVLTNRSAVGVRVWCPEGSLENTGAFRPKDLVEARHVFGVAIADEELWIDPSVSEIAGYVSCLLGDPISIGVGGDTGDPDSSASQLDKEEDVEAMQQHRVNAEEVGRHDVRRLGTEERPPCGTRPARRWSHVMIKEDQGDGAAGQADAELQKLALDAPVTPPRVLLGQAHHEGAGLVVDRRTPGWAVRVGPPASHQPAVPGHQCGRRHAEAGPPGAGEQSAECAEQCTIGWLEGLALHLASEHRHFMAERE